MKPSVEDQLLGSCRILEEVVAPHVAEPFARVILDGLVANLRMLTDAIPAVPGFLCRDNDATAQLLDVLKDAMTEEQETAWAEIEKAPSPGPSDMNALDARNRQLRDILARAVCSETLSAEQHGAIIAHMWDRASQMPMRYVATAPAPPSKENT